MLLGFHTKEMAPSEGLLLLLLATSSPSAMAATLTNSWAVQLQFGGNQAATSLARKYGFTNEGKVMQQV